MPLFPYPLDKVSGVYQSTSGSGSRNQTLHAVVHHGSIQFITSVERERVRGRERVPHRSYNYGFRARFVFPPSTAIRAATPVGLADTRAVIKGGRQHTQVRRSTSTLSSSVHFLSNTLHTCPQQTHADTHTKKSN